MLLSALASRRALRRAVAIAGATAAIAGGFVATSAGAAPSAPPPVHTGAAYLALGDSVPFGFREPTNLPTPDYTKAASFIGFPKMVAADLGLRLTNAACPGETTSSFIDVNAQSNGCENVVPGSQTPPYRPNFPLHTSYDGSQLAFAVNFLKTHPGTRLVSIMLGANDGFVCEEEHNGVCAGQDLLDTLTTIHNNLTKIFKRLRGTGYTGQIVVVNYYSNNYADATQTGLVQGLNQVIDSSAQPFDVAFANSFRVFQRAVAQTNGDDCAAGVLTILQAPSTGCGVHPSLAGHALLASAVERVTVKS